MAFGRKTETHEQRLARTTASKDAALGVFATAAEQLDAAHAAAEEVYADLDFEISRLAALRDKADRESDEARSKAALIRKTFLGV